VREQHRGFTLVEVLVALMVVAMGLAALMVAVSGTARTSGVLRDKTIAQWIALNRLTEVRLNLNKFGKNTDTGELDFANRKWHYDTRYFDTTIGTMKRVVVRVYQGDSKTKGNPLVESIGFLGTAVGLAGGSNVDWTAGSLPTQPAANGNGTGASGTGAGTGTGTGTPPSTGTQITPTQPSNPAPAPPTTPTPEPTP
jgi:general secretion pathway protein I